MRRRPCTMFSEFTVVHRLRALAAVASSPPPSTPLWSFLSRRVDPARVRLPCRRRWPQRPSSTVHRGRRGRCTARQMERTIATDIMQVRGRHAATICKCDSLAILPTHFFALLLLLLPAAAHSLPSQRRSHMIMPIADKASYLERGVAAPLCSEHNVPQEVYCTKCSETLCSNCASSPASAHRDHPGALQLVAAYVAFERPKFSPSSSRP
jgi:hypothetical protein